MGGCLSSLAPTLFQACTRKKITVAQALDGHRWTRHLRANLSPQALSEGIMVWEKIQDVVLSQGTPDSVSWRWTSDGKYTSATAYAAQFACNIRTNFCVYIWQGDAPMRCRIYAWLAVQGRCLTADALARRGWPHND
jgi:hypothetical protein